KPLIGDEAPDYDFDTALCHDVFHLPRRERQAARHTSSRHLSARKLLLRCALGWIIGSREELLKTGPVAPKSTTCRSGRKLLFEAVALHPDVQLRAGQAEHLCCSRLVEPGFGERLLDHRPLHGVDVLGAGRRPMARPSSAMNASLSEIMSARRSGSGGSRISNTFKR